MFRGSEVALVPGDTLVLYTDGITEARSAEGEEFGESRLLDTLRRHCHLPVKPLLEAVVKAVEQFSGGEQLDDIHVGDCAVPGVAGCGEC
jgi:serine phosphatase RsbU (regulator of sigma subunit)